MVIDLPRVSAWQPATVLSLRRETTRVTSIRFAVADWPGHLPGQHVDVRLVAPDGYRAERSYSLATPVQVGIELTVEELEGGEVSPFLTQQLTPGDTIQMRGPIGGHFVWSAPMARAPLVLVAGGSGIVPLMCMLRQRSLTGSTVPAALLYSCRTSGDVIFGDELAAIARHDGRVSIRVTLTRHAPRSWSGGRGRIDGHAIARLLRSVDGQPEAYVCGNAGFVETASDLLVQAGQPALAIRTERFGPTGG